MHALRGILVLFFTALAFSALTPSCGSSSSTDACQSSCDKVSGCGLVANGFTCAGDCAENGCAYCIQTKVCDDLKSGQCSVVCRGVDFVKK